MRSRCRGLREEIGRGYEAVPMDVRVLGRLCGDFNRFRNGGRGLDPDRLHERGAGSAYPDNASQWKVVGVGRLSGKLDHRRSQDLRVV